MGHFLTVLTIFSSSDLPATAAVGAGAGIYFFYRGFRLLQRRRLILNTPSSKIRSAAMGLVEVNGLAKGPQVLTSPLKHSDCFYYRSIAWEWRQQGKSSEWVKIGEEALQVPFYVDDSTGILLINPAGAEMDLHCNFREEYGSLFGTSQLPDSVSQFLSRHGANFDKKIKVEEYVIQPENYLFVLGTLAQNSAVNAANVPASSSALPDSSSVPPLAATANAGAASGHRPLVDATGQPLVGANYRQVVHLSADSTPTPATEMTQQQRVAAALIKAGITNPVAWATAGVSAAESGQTKPYSPKSNGNVGANNAHEMASANETQFDPHPPVVLMKGTHDSTFLISWRSQRELLSSLGWKAALMIWGGPALTLVCVYFLLANFNLL